MPAIDLISRSLMNSRCSGRGDRAIDQRPNRPLGKTTLCENDLCGHCSVADHAVELVHADIAPGAAISGLAGVEFIRHRLFPFDR